jgi:hypothetical protein
MQTDKLAEIEQRAGLEPGELLRIVNAAIRAVVARELAPPLWMGPVWGLDPSIPHEMSVNANAHASQAD